MAKDEFSFLGFSYRHFSWMGNAFQKVFFTENWSLEKTLKDAGLKIYPQAYYSLLGFLFLATFIVVIPIVIFTFLIPLIILPFLVILLGAAIPRVMAHDRAQKLDLEVPFAGTYISVMATGGLSPYASLRRLKDCALLPNISKAIKDIEIDVEIKGVDPVTAMEDSASNLPSKDYRNLMLGYASTMRTGGDVLHYLVVRTESMFRDLAIKVKAFGERASLLMETYITMSILLTLMLTVMFMTTLSFQDYLSGGLDTSTFLIYGYFITPGLAAMFIFIADSQQISTPLSDWRAYKAFFALIPVAFLLILVLFLPFSAPDIAPSFAAPFASLITWMRTIVGLPRGYEAGLGLGITFAIISVLGTIIYNYYNRMSKGIDFQVTSFMRDLTEARKTGSSPERCLENLAGIKYGAFTPILATASRQIRWGLPFKVIYETFRAKINSWLSLINIYLLVDAIEVGGGTPETLETLTHFSEELSSLEKEKKAAQRPLVIMPYIGVGILIFSTLVFLSFSQTILSSYSNQVIPYSLVVTLLLPPLMVQIFTIGLVTGKLSGGSVASGFKHAMLLTIMGLVFMPLAGYLTLPFAGT